MARKNSHFYPQLVGLSYWADISCNMINTLLPQPLGKKCVMKNQFSYFSTQTYVVGTQKNHLKEMVLSSIQSKCLN